MPRFQLLVREPGKEPRCVPIGDPMIVGRSRSVDLTVADEEVGRKQFKIGVTSGFVVLEGLGATNPTRVDDSLIKAGEKTTLPAGARILVGKTEFVLESADATEDRPPAPPDVIENTMVAGSLPGGPGGPGGPGRPGGPGGGSAPTPPAATPPAATPPAGATPPSDDAPLHTMEFQTPGGPRGAAPPASTPAKPPTPPAATPPATTPPAASTPPMNTMEFRPPGLAGAAPGQTPPGGPIGSETAAAGRPQPPTPPAAPPATPTPETGDFGQTMAKGFRPGSPGGAPLPPPATPKAAAPSPAAPQRTAPPPAAPPPVVSPPVAPPAAPAPKAAVPQPPEGSPAAAATPLRPKTVAVNPEDIAPPAITTAAGDDLESLLHQATPRLFVKGEGLKRPVRLMKAISKIGRAETADVLLPHESVSEQHAEIRFDGSSWTLVDSGSTNGCVVDGQHLRNSEQVVRRNALISIGSLNLIFLCTNKATAAQDRRDEDRALQLLTKNGRIDKATANEIRQMVRAEPSHSIAEIVLRDTPLAPVEWANAVTAGRRKVSFLARILRLFTGGK